MRISSSQYDCHCSTNASAMDAEYTHKAYCPFQQLPHPPPARTATRRHHFLRSDTEAASSTVKEDTESFCLIIFVHLVLHLMLWKTFLSLRSGAVYVFVTPSVTTSIIALVITPPDCVLVTAPSAATAIVVPHAPLHSLYLWPRNRDSYATLSAMSST